MLALLQYLSKRGPYTPFCSCALSYKYLLYHTLLEPPSSIPSSRDFGVFFLFFIFFLFFALFRIGLVIFSSSATLINQVPCVKPFTTVYVLSLYCSRRRVFFFQCLILPSLAVSFAVSPSLAVSLSLLCLFFTSVLPSVFFSFVTRHLKLLSVRHKPWSGER